MMHVDDPCGVADTRPRRPRTHVPPVAKRLRRSFRRSARVARKTLQLVPYGRGMVRLIPLPDRDGRPGDARLWINPDHITSVAPIVTRGGDENGAVYLLAVDLKLEGLPMQRAWLATCHTPGETDQKWQQFLDLVAGSHAP
jgi:hypothetical protein